MARRNRTVSDEIARFPQVVEHGSLVELQTALDHGADVNVAGDNGRTALVVSIAARDLAKLTGQSWGGSRTFRRL